MTEPKPLPSRLTPTQRVLLVLLFLAAALLRFAGITSASLWKDEIWSIEMAMGRGSLHDQLPVNIIRTDQPQLTNLSAAAPWWQILTHSAGVTHPPLYFIALRFWLDLFGASPLAARSLSALFSLACVYLLFDLCRFLHGSSVALLSAALCAVAIAQIDFAQDTRGYTMLLFFALASANLLVRIERLGPTARRLILLAISLWAEAMTHYLCAGFIAALTLYTLLRIKSLPSQNAHGAAVGFSPHHKTFLALILGVSLALIAWIPLLLSQKNTLPSLLPTFLQESRQADHVKLTLFRIIGLPAEFVLGETGGEALARIGNLILNPVLAIFIVTVVIPIIRLRRRPDLLLWILWSGCTVGFVAALDLIHRSTLTGYLRYTVLASPAVYVSIAAFRWPRGRFENAFAIVCLLILSITAVRAEIQPPPAKEDWRGLATAVIAASQPNDLFVFTDRDPWVTPGIWYMGLQYYSPTSHHPWLILSTPPAEKVLRDLQPRQLFWLIGDPPTRDATQLLPGWRPDLEISTSAGIAWRMVPANP